MKGTKRSTLIFARTELSSTDERELIERFQNGDTEAFNPLVLKYRQKIYNLLYERVRDREIAKDLTQDVFLKAFQGLPHFKQDSKFYSWLYRIASNCGVDFIRKQKRQKVLMFGELPPDADNILQMVQVYPSPSKMIENEELGQIIRKAVHQLSPGQQRVFKLRYRMELSIKEIAVRLKKPEGTVKSQLYQAHQKLQRLLIPYLQNEPLHWNGEDENESDSAM